MEIKRMRLPNGNVLDYYSTGLERDPNDSAEWGKMFNNCDCDHCVFGILSQETGKKLCIRPGDKTCQDGMEAFRTEN